MADGKITYKEEIPGWAVLLDGVKVGKVFSTQRFGYRYWKISGGNKRRLFGTRKEAALALVDEFLGVEEAPFDFPPQL